MHGLMMDAPLTITEIMKFGERNYPNTEVVSVTLDNPPAVFRGWGYSG